MRQINNITKYFIVPLVLILLWVTLLVRYVYQNDLGILNLDLRLKSNILIGIPLRAEIYQGETIFGEFTDTYPNLGIIGVRFDNRNRINKDKIEFRLKESGARDWYYKAQYNTDQFQREGIFPIGFVPIAESVGKSYFFEIESLEGTISSAIAISHHYPTIIARHVFTGKSLLENGSLFSYFVLQKVSNLFYAQDFAFHFIVYSLPLLFYLLFILLGITYHVPVLVVFIALLADIFLLPGVNDFLTLSIIFAWILPMIKFKIENKVSASIALVLLPVFALSFSFGLANIAEKIATWAYLFFVIAFIQKIYEFYASPTQCISVSEFWKSIKVQWGNYIVLSYWIAVGEVTINLNSIKEGQKELGIARRTLANNGNELISLMLYRLGQPITIVYIYTTKVFVIAIFLLILSLKVLIKFFPSTLFIYLMCLQIKYVSRYFRFYNDFFISNQETLFWNQVGYFLSGIFFLYILIYLFFQRRLRLRAKTLLAIIFLLLSINTAHWFYRSVTSKFENDLIIWSVSPNDIQEPWADVVIEGRNFGEMPFYGQVLNNGLGQRIISWSDRKIIFRTNPNTTKSGRLEIITAEEIISQPVDFYYIDNK